MFCSACISKYCRCPFNLVYHIARLSLSLFNVTFLHFNMRYLKLRIFFFNFFFLFRFLLVFFKTKIITGG